MALFLVVMSGCVSARTAEVGPGHVDTPPAVTELWVDAFGPSGGDGGRQNPLRAVPSKAPPGAVIHLGAGLYAGPLELPAGGSLVGSGAAVLFLEGPGDVLRSHGGTLQGISIQGGGVGVRALEGHTAFDHVHFSGHRTSAVDVAPDAGVAMVSCAVEGSVSGTQGLAVHGGSASVTDTTFTGGLRAAVQGDSGARLTLSKLDVKGPKMAVHALDSTTTVRDSEVSGGSGPAFFATRGTLSVERCRTQGHEYAVQTGPGTGLSVQGLVAKQNALAAIGVVQSEVRVTNLTVEGGGALGAVQSLDGTLRLEHARLKSVLSVGVLVRKGTATLLDVTVDGVRGERERDGSMSLGDGVHVRSADVTIDQLVVRDAEGSALFAGAGAHVTLGTLDSERVGAGAIVVERQAVVHAHEVTSRGSLSSAVAVPDDAELSIERLAVTGGGTPVWAECAQGAHVRIGHFEGAVPLAVSTCVELTPASK